MAVVISKDRGRWWNDMFQQQVSPAWVVVRRERGCGHQNHMFQQLSKVPVVTKNEFDGHKIEIAENVVLSTPSTIHLLGLPYQGSSLSFSHPPTSALFLQNIAHIPQWGEGLKNQQSSCKGAKNCLYWRKNQGGDRKKIKHIMSKFFLRARGRD